MKLFACGLRYATIPWAVREQVVFSPASMATALREIKQLTQAEEVVMLSTCNRTEFYGVNGQVTELCNWLCQTKQLSPELLQDAWYTHHHNAALRHLLRVASGLDSIIVGEAQIVGQLKQAFFFAESLGFVKTQLRPLLNYLLKTTKQIRQQTEINAHPVSLGFAVVHAAKQIFARLAETRVLLIGAGETITLVAKHLVSQGIQHFYVANRTPEHAKKLVQTIGAQLISLEQMNEQIPSVDIVISATASTSPLITKEALASTLKKRRRRPLFIADLAVPSDIEVAVNQLEDVYLSTLDDFQYWIQKNQASRRTAAITAEALITEKIEDYRRLEKNKEASLLIKAYRQQAKQDSEQELNQAFALLKKGFPVEEVLKRFSYRLTNKLLHIPSVALRNAMLSDQKKTLDAMTELLEKK